MAEADELKNAVNHVLLILKNNPAPTDADVRKAATMVAGWVANMDVVVGVDELIRQVEALVNLHQAEASVLDNRADDHQAWLKQKSSSIKWKFWERYKYYLETEKNIRGEVMERLDEVTDMVLGRLEDPNRPGKWDRRGMVVGDVQSGKTSNYTGLVCKAADAGYSAIIILAGMHNNLRSQTQERIDLGFLGFDTEKNLVYNNDTKKVGVGLLPQQEFQNLPVLSLTSIKGDFKKAIAEGPGISQLGSLPFVFVIKKYKSVLENLCDWLNERAENASVLIIDDEADNASVNTLAMPEPGGDDPREVNPTTINRLIRALLMKFKKRAYVGYTATPFANIFIHKDHDHSLYGPDLFPSAFIINLHSPSNHVGPAEVFGLPEDRRANLEEQKGLPIVRTVKADEAQEFMPAGHKRDYRPAKLPPTLIRAIHSYVISCALRDCRGQENEHQSMLIHVTRFIDVQKELKKLVLAAMQDISSTLKMEGLKNAELMEELKTLWDEDYAPKCEEIRGQWEDPLMTPVEWECVKGRLGAVVSRIQVEAMNGETGDIRHYKEAKNGCYLIAIGGNKLSRGLTLEGLTVSYFLRASHMYDTLMQMGRWFGYRPGYVDACRLFLTTELVEWYQYIAIAMIELRQDFDHMSDINSSPEEFGLRVRQHPAELEITAANKMRTGTEMQVSFADTLVETVVFEKNGPNAHNLEAAGDFFRRLGEFSRPERRPDYYAWQANGAEVVEFLRAYKPPRDASNTRGSRIDLITEYIDAQIKLRELTDWTVILASRDSSLHSNTTSHDFGEGLVSGLWERNNAPGTARTHHRLIKDHLISPKDETIDLNMGPDPSGAPTEWDVALDVTRKLWLKSTRKNKSQDEPVEPNGKGVRNARSPRNGLLLIYLVSPQLDERKFEDPIYTAFAISFPASKSGTAVTYTVNNVYSDEFGIDYEPEA